MQAVLAAVEPLAAARVHAASLVAPAHREGFGEGQVDLTLMAPKAVPKAFMVAMAAAVSAFLMAESVLEEKKETQGRSVDWAAKMGTPYVAAVSSTCWVVLATVGVVGSGSVEAWMEVSGPGCGRVNVEGGYRCKGGCKGGCIGGETSG